MNQMKLEIVNEETLLVYNFKFHLIHLIQERNFADRFTIMAEEMDGEFLQHNHGGTTLLKNKSTNYEERQGMKNVESEQH